MSRADGTIWVLAEAGPDAELGKAIAELHKCSAEGKALENRAKLAKATLEAHCEAKWLAHVGSTGNALPAPVKLVNAAGQSVGFVVQDRTGSASITDDAYDAIADAIGECNASFYASEKRSLSFDENILAEETLDGRKVSEAAEEYLRLMVADMLAAKIVTQGQADNLLQIEKTLRLKSGFLERLPKLCAPDASKFGEVVKALGSAVVRFVKA